MTEEYVKQEKYQKALDYEQLLFFQIERISKFRSNKDYEHYEISIETFIMMLPKVLRDKAMEYKKNNDLTIDSGLVTKWDELWVFINERLEDNNLIFKTSYIKTFF